MLSDSQTSIPEHLQHDSPNDIHGQIICHGLHLEDFLVLDALIKYLAEPFRFLHNTVGQAREIAGTETWIENASPRLPEIALHSYDIKTFRDRHQERPQGGILWKRVFLRDLVKPLGRSNNEHLRSKWPCIKVVDRTELRIASPNHIC